MTKPAAIPRHRPSVRGGLIVSELLRSTLSDDRSGVAELEAAFSAWLGGGLEDRCVMDTVAVSAVRLALYHTLRELDLPPGAGVLCAPLTVWPVVDAILGAGLTPVLVEMEPSRFGMDLEHARSLLDAHARVLLATHLWGVPADLPGMADFATRHGLVLLEDASQCLGGRVGGQKAGTFGRASFFSLGATKPVTSLSGAFLTTPDPLLSRKVRDRIAALPSPSRRQRASWCASLLAQRVVTSPGVYSQVGAPLMERILASRWKRLLDGSPPPAGAPGGTTVAAVQTGFGRTQARVALSTLSGVDERIRRCAPIQARLQEELAGVAGLAIPEAAPDCRGNATLFPVFHADAPGLRRHLAWTARVDAAPSSVDPIHEIGPVGLRALLPVASRLHRECVCLPIHPELSEGDVDRMIGAVRSFCRGAESTPRTGTSP